MNTTFHAPKPVESMAVSSRIAAGMTSTGRRDAPDGSGVLVAFVRLLVRQAAAEASRGVQPCQHRRNTMHTPARLPRLLTVKEAAQSLHVSTKTIDRWRLDGTLPFLKLGRLIRIAESEIEAFLRNRQKGRRR